MTDRLEEIERLLADMHRPDTDLGGDIQRYDLCRQFAQAELRRSAIAHLRWAVDEIKLFRAREQRLQKMATIALRHDNMRTIRNRGKK